MRKLAIALGLAVIAWQPSGTLADDRAPTAEERAQIEAVLRDAGYVSWEEIEFDDGLWEVDDARAADGREYDLKLDPNTLAVVARKED